MTNENTLKTLGPMAAASESAPQVALASVLDFLFAANLEASDAFAAARSLMEAGVNSPESIAALTPERVKSLTAKQCHRKLLAALRKKSFTLEKASDSPSKRQKEATVPPPPPLPSQAQALPDVVLNRSPVMILWATAIAHEVLGYTWAESLSLASASAAVFARAKGHSLGLHASSGGGAPSSARDADVRLLGKVVPCERTADGALRGLSEHKHKVGCFDPVSPSGVFRALSAAFKDTFGAAWHALLGLARAVPRASLLDNDNELGFQLYANFRPSVPQGLAGWGAPGRLRLATVDEMRRSYLPTSSPGPGPPVKAEASESIDEQGLLPSAVKAEEASAPADGIKRVFAEVERLGAASVEELVDVLGGGMDAATVRCWVEELQLDGMVYQNTQGQFVPL